MPLGGSESVPDVVELEDVDAVDLAYITFSVPLGGPASVPDEMEEEEELEEVTDDTAYGCFRWEVEPAEEDR